MLRRFCFCGMILVAISLALMLSGGDASAQWLPGQSQQQYPPPQPGSQHHPSIRPRNPGISRRRRNIRRRNPNIRLSSRVPPSSRFLSHLRSPSLLRPSLNFHLRCRAKSFRMPLGGSR